MTVWLREEGYQVNRKRVQKLMGKMGLEEIYPRPGLSVAGPEHKVYPYLLPGVEIDHPNQVLYNHERLHQALGYRTPAQVYLGESAARPCLVGGES